MARMKRRPAESRPGQVYETLRARILDNIYAPGARVLEGELAAVLGVSRTPVREALIRLQDEGLVQVTPRHGMQVLPVSADDMRELYAILTALESMAAELAASRSLDDDALRPLVEASHDMERALKADDLDAWAAADERYHRHLIELSGNKLLVQAVLRYWDRAHRARMITLRLRPRPVDSTREHLELVERLRAGDARGAFDAYRAHRERAARELIRIFEQYRLQHV